MAFACGKIILLGEHAVVYGQPAIAAGINLGINAVARRKSQSGPNDLNVLSIEPLGIRIEESTALKAKPETLLHDAFIKALRHYDPAALGPLHVQVKSALWPGAGLGSSAAIGAAVFRAIDEIHNIQRPPIDLAQKVLDWDKTFHGNPSGIDSTVVCNGGVVYYVKGEPGTQLEHRAPMWWVVAHSGETASTKDMVAAVSGQAARNPKRLEKTFEGIGELSRYARHIIKDGLLDELGQLLDLNQALLNTLMVSTPRIEELCSLARSKGALGAKLSGSGGGGCIIALARDKEHAYRLKEDIMPQTPRVFVTCVESAMPTPAKVPSA